MRYRGLTGLSLALGPGLLFAALGFAGCAQGGDGQPDGGMPAIPDASSEIDGGAPDAGIAGCLPDQHLCGMGCVNALANEPENGCRLGCGEPCPAPMGAIASCGGDGLCAFECMPPFTPSDGSCTCTPTTCETLGRACGLVDDGCGTSLDCGGCDGSLACVDGSCGCAADEGEPNETFEQAESRGWLATPPDDEIWRQSYTLYGLASEGDVDVFRVRIEDDGLLSPDPVVEIQLAAIPDGADYDLSAYFVCDEGGNDSTCTAGSDDNVRGKGCTSANSGSVAERVGIDVECTPLASTSDDGVLYIRVSARTHGGSCAPYQLSISIVN